MNRIIPRVDLKKAHLQLTTDVTELNNTDEHIKESLVNYRLRAENATDVEVFDISRSIDERKKHQDILTNRLCYEENLAKFSNSLLLDHPNIFDHCLQHLLNAAQCSRVAFYQNFIDQDKRIAFRPTHEACAEGVAPELNNPVLQHIVYERDGFGRWKNELSHDRIIHGSVSTFPESERNLLESQNSKSMLAIPIRVNREWVGFIAFDDTVFGREWTDVPTEGRQVSENPERNRAAPVGQDYATVTYSIDSGHGIGDDIGEPINAGFRGTSPLSSGIDLRAYQGADGVYVEFIAYDIEEDGTIRLDLLDAKGNVIWSGTVKVKAGPRQVARFLVPGLVLGETYSFKVRDEVGKIWSAPEVAVKPFAAEMISMSLAGVTLAFESLPDRDYEVQWTARLGKPWQTVATVASQGERTSAVVTHPDPTSPTGFFRIRLK